jgi:hypothetical protein
MGGDGTHLPPLLLCGWWWSSSFCRVSSQWPRKGRLEEVGEEEEVLVWLLVLLVLLAEA